MKKVKFLLMLVCFLSIIFISCAVSLPASFTRPLQDNDVVIGEVVVNVSAKNLGPQTLASVGLQVTNEARRLFQGSLAVRDINVELTKRNLLGNNTYKVSAKVVQTNE